jgi:RNA polymerase sigma-70 factor (ECF subfamily)
LADNLQDIIKGCVAGKIKYQELLYKQYAKKLFGVCLLYTKDYTAAEDILQDGFIKIYNNIGQFQEKGSFEGWMRKIMVHTALERFRKRTFLYPVEDLEDYAEDYTYDDITSNISAQDLLKLVHELPPQYQMVFNLYAIEGYAHEEVSQIMGISTGTSKSNLSRARKILQDKVNSYYENRKTVHGLMIVDK